MDGEDGAMESFLDVGRRIESGRFGTLLHKREERAAQVLESGVWQLMGEFVTEAVQGCYRLPKPVITRVGAHRRGNGKLLCEPRLDWSQPPSLSEILLQRGYVVQKMFKTVLRTT